MKLQSSKDDPAIPTSQVIKLEIRCGNCGYGAVVAHPLDRCPMCGTNTWLELGALMEAFGAPGSCAGEPVGERPAGHGLVRTGGGVEV